jgi:hypothetical protein
MISAILIRAGPRVMRQLSTAQALQERSALRGQAGAALAHGYGTHHGVDVLAAASPGRLAAAGATRR